MKIIIRTLLLAILLTFFGCASITYLPTDESVTYTPTESIKIYWNQPEEPYTAIGRVSAKSEDYGEKTLFNMLKEKAMSVGAHAIIMDDTSQHSTIVGTPMSGGGTMIIPVTSTRLEGTAIRFNK